MLPGMGNDLAGMQNTMPIYTYYALFLYAGLHLRAFLRMDGMLPVVPLCMLHVIASISKRHMLRTVMQRTDCSRLALA
jgi:hypothetical protein